MNIEAKVDELNRRLLADLGSEDPFQWIKAEDLQILANVDNPVGRTAYRPVWQPVLDPSYFGRYVLARKERGTLLKHDWAPWIVSDERNPLASHFTSEVGQAPTTEKTSWAIQIIRGERDKYKGKDLADINKQVAKDYEEARIKAGREAAEQAAAEFEDAHQLYGQWRLPGAKTFVSAPTPGAPNTLIDKDSNDQQ